MKSNALVGLRAVLWSVCAFHVLFGLGLTASSDFVDVGAKMYGADVAEWSPQFLYILHPLGVFMLALGVLAGAAALDPVKHRITVYVFAGIFVMRALQRIVLGGEIHETFGIEAGRNIGNMAFFFLLAATLVVLDQLVQRPFKPKESAPTT